MNNAYLYWQAKNDIFQFGHTPHRQVDGKFHAYKWKNGQRVKDVAFGKRKTARRRAAEWYEKRVEQLKKMEDNSKVRQQFKRKPQLTDEEKKAKKLSDNISIAQKRMKELNNIIKLSTRRIKNAQTRIEMWQRKERRWIKQIEEINKADARVKAMVRTL